MRHLMSWLERGDPMVFSTLGFVKFDLIVRRTTNPKNHHQLSNWTRNPNLLLSGFNSCSEFLTFQLHWVVPKHLLWSHWGQNDTGSGRQTLDGPPAAGDRQSLQPTRHGILRISDFHPDGVLSSLPLFQYKNRPVSVPGMVDAAAQFVSKAKSCSIERVLEANLDNATAAYGRLKLSPRKGERKGQGQGGHGKERGGADHRSRSPTGRRHQSGEDLRKHLGRKYRRNWFSDTQRERSLMRNFLQAVRLVFKVLSYSVASHLVEIRWYLFQTCYYASGQMR